jgi:hypothetical protein
MQLGSDNVAPVGLWELFPPEWLLLLFYAFSMVFITTALGYSYNFIKLSNIYRIYSLKEIR